MASEEEVGTYQISISADGNGTISEVLINTKSGEVVSRTKADTSDYTELDRAEEERPQREWDALDTDLVSKGLKRND